MALNLRSGVPYAPIARLGWSISFTPLLPSETYPQALAGKINQEYHAMVVNLKPRNSMLYSALDQHGEAYAADPDARLKRKQVGLE